MPAGMHLLRRLKFLPPSPPSFFLVFNLLCQEKDKSFIMPEVWPQAKVPKRCFRAFSTWACAISAGTWQAFRVTFAIIHKLHIPSVLLHKGPSFFFLACTTALPLKPEAAELTLYKEFQINSDSHLGEETIGVHYWFCFFIVIVSVYSRKWGFLWVAPHKVQGRQHTFLRNFKVFFKVQQIDIREEHSTFIICKHTYFTYTLKKIFLYTSLTCPSDTHLPQTVGCSQRGWVD